MLGQALGDYTSKIGTGAIGGGEIADGQVHASELGAITKRVNSETVAPGILGVVTAECEPGEVRLSGGGSSGGLNSGIELVSSAPSLGGLGWTVIGRNGGSDTRSLFTQVLCLS